MPAGHQGSCECCFAASGMGVTRACAAVPGHKETKQKIGTLRLPVEEVVRNNKIRDSWALQVAYPTLH